MLKIKAEKMKDLEKFGFKYDNFGFYIFSTELPYGTPHILIDEDTRHICISTGDNILTKIYDLIKAGMVEKVVEDGRI